MLEVPLMELYVQSGYTDPTQATTRMVIDRTKEWYWRQQFCQLKRHISVRPTKKSGPVKVDHLQTRPKFFGRIEPKWSVPFDF